ncbi:hypothetical protein U1Q18_041259 [Sarracenia purpurea var. burkii]
MHLLMMNQVGHLSLLPEDEEIINTSPFLFPPTQPACFDPKKRMNRMVLNRLHREPLPTNLGRISSLQPHWAWGFPLNDWFLDGWEKNPTPSVLLATDPFMGDEPAPPMISICFRC